MSEVQGWWRPMLADARQYLSEGRLERAEAACREVLDRHPQCSEALELAGLIAHARGQSDAAVDFLQQAVAADGRQGQAHYNLGFVLHTLGKIEEAVVSYRRALELGRSSETYNNLGYALFQLGRLDEALPNLQNALRQNPAHAEAHNNLGLTFAARGEGERAVESYRRAIRLKPEMVEAHYNLGLALAGLGKNYEAIACYRRVLELRPGHAEAQVRLGRLLHQLGDADAIQALQAALRLDPDDPFLADDLGNALARANRFQEALEHYQQAVRIVPDNVAFLNNFGHGLRMSGKLDEAAEAFQRVLELSPNVSEAHANLGRIWAERRLHGEAIKAFERALEIDPNNSGARSALGNLLKEQGRSDDAIEQYQEALRRQPNDHSTHVLLGNIYTELRRYPEAERCYRDAILQEPADATTHSNLSNALNVLGRPQEADAEARLAIALRPGFADAFHNRSIALMSMGRDDEALAARREALRLKPDYPEARLCNSLDLLRQANFDDGWIEYEWRWKLKMHTKPIFTQPEWDGSPLVGRTILLYAEQGLGDTLQFIRYATLVQKCGGRVVVECQKPLVKLLASAGGIDQLVPVGEPRPHFDVQLPLLSVPRLLRTTLESIPCDVPYLFADAALCEQWQAELAAIDGFKIGIAWQGNRGFIGDSMRSLPLSHFEHVARLPGVRLLSLQKGFGREQLADLAGSFEVIDFTDRMDVSHGAFMDTAAVMRQLDLVITSDSAIAHLAGALGVPVWIAVSRGADWRWLDERGDSPWYPTMRIFRQHELGDWDNVFQRIAAEVEREMARRGTPFGTVTSPTARACIGVSRQAAATAALDSPLPTVSIVTPWRDHAELIADYERAVQGAQVIVVDNGSQPAAAAELRAMVERLGGVYLRNEHNAGFAAANNQGFAHAEGEIVIFLNNDVAGGPEFLQAVCRDVQPAELVGAQMGSHMLWGLMVPYLIGWCVAARREVFQQLAGWDAAAFVDPFWEDNDLSLRAIEAGFGVRQSYWPIHHKGGTSLGGMLSWGDVYERNRATFAARVERVYRRMRAENGDATVSLPSAKQVSLQGAKRPATAGAGVPLVSVVIPCHNGSAYLAACIDSVLAQEASCEIIVVDDGSTDDSLSVAVELMRQSPVPTRVITQANGGPAVARNTGLRFAEGKYVCFLDVDDEYLPDFFAAALEQLEAAPPPVAAGCGVQLVNLHRPAEPWHANLVADSIPGNLLMRTDAARRIGGFPTQDAFRGKAAGEDIAFRQQLFRLGKVAILKEPLYRYRVQRGSHFDMLVDRVTNRDGRIELSWFTPEEADGRLKRALSEYAESVRSRESARLHPQFAAALTELDDFQRLASVFQSIAGWLRPVEGFALYWLARYWPADGLAVEIGSFKGRSTCWLASGCREAGRGKLAAIDHFRGSPEHQVGGAHGDGDIANVGSTLDVFRANGQAAGLEDWIDLRIGESLDVCRKWSEPIRLVFIDGDHSWEAVTADFAAWSRFVSPHGLVVLHDVGVFPDVTRFFEQFRAETPGWKAWPRIESLGILEKV